MKADKKEIGHFLRHDNGCSRIVEYVMKFVASIIRTVCAISTTVDPSIRYAVSCRFFLGRLVIGLLKNGFPQSMPFAGL